MRVRDILARATFRLTQAGVEDARAEARRLLCWAAGIDLTAIVTLLRLDDTAQARFEAVIARRARREPYAYITGTRGFWTQDFLTNEHTLIPRADSETLIEALLHHKSQRERPYRILDLGTGTGCLLLAALSHYPNARGIGVDIVPEAAQLARENAKLNQLEQRAQFVASHWGDALTGCYDIILSNPPYIRTGEMPGLMPEVRYYEPATALDGGASGLDAYAAILTDLPRLMRHDGIAVLELGKGQDHEVKHLAAENGLEMRACYNDLNGIARAMILGLGAF